MRLQGLYGYRDLLQQLVLRDIKLKYRRSFLGYVWSVLNPLLIMLVMTLVFSTMFKRNIENFAVYMLTGSILYNFNTEATNNAMRSITGSAALLKKIYVPKYIFPLAKVTSSLVNLLFAFGALIIVMLFTGVPFRWTNLLFFIPVVELYVFSLGLGIFLSQFAVFFRDIEYIYSVITTAWFYATPIFYPLETLSPPLFWVITRLNPLFYYIMQFRQIILYDRVMEFQLVWKGALISVLMLCIGTWFFKRNQDKFMLYI